MPVILMRTLLLFGLLGYSLPDIAAVCNRVPVTDRLTGQRWDRVTDCEHPEWPARLVPLENADDHGASGSGLAAPSHVTFGDAAPGSHSVPVEIHAGARIELWSRGAVGLHLTGVAMEAAGVGQPIRVRSSLGPAILRGIVRGPHSVELLAPGWARNRWERNP